MSIINFIVLSAAIGVSGTADANERKALEYTAKALYKYHRIDRTVKVIEERYTPEWVKENPWIILAIKIGSERKISYQWSF